MLSFPRTVLSLKQSTEPMQVQPVPYRRKAQALLSNAFGTTLEALAIVLQRRLRPPLNQRNHLRLPFPVLPSAPLEASKPLYAGRGKSSRGILLEAVGHRGWTALSLSAEAEVWMYVRRNLASSAPRLGS